MDLFDAALMGVIGTLLLVLTASIAVFIAAVWLGLHVIAPRFRRALDRAEAEDEGARDRLD